MKKKSGVALALLLQVTIRFPLPSLEQRPLLHVTRCQKGTTRTKKLTPPRGCRHARHLLYTVEQVSGVPEEGDRGEFFCV